MTWLWHANDIKSERAYLWRKHISVRNRYDLQISKSPEGETKSLIKQVFWANLNFLKLFALSQLERRERSKDPRSPQVRNSLCSQRAPGAAEGRARTQPSARLGALRYPPRGAPRPPATLQKSTPAVWALLNI